MDPILRQLASTSLACAAVLTSISCRSAGPLFPGENQSARGTLSGTVSGPDGTSPVSGRRVVAIEIATRKRYSTRTNVEGGYTLLIPPGTYRIEVALGRGEVVVKRPEPVEVKAGEVAAGVDVTFGGAGIAKPPGSR